ncbi:MAG: hypothetical protein RJA29_2515, partial [Pseudomonadota bacterium]
MLTKKEQRLRRARQTRIRIATQGVARLTVNRTNLHIYATVVSACGTKVVATASSAASAYEKLEQIEPDLVFLDIKLKGEEDGIHIAGHIKEKYNIPVIFLTSYVDQETLDRAKVTEPYGYIVKPFNESDLKTT